MTAVEKTYRGHVLIGFVLIVVGSAFLVERMNLLDADPAVWPLFPLVIGLVRLLSPDEARRHRGGRRAGVWLIYIGIWGLLNEFELFGLDYHNSWPLLVIAAGLNMVWRSLETGRRPQES